MLSNASLPNMVAPGFTGQIIPKIRMGNIDQLLRPFPQGTPLQVSHPILGDYIVYIYPRSGDHRPGSNQGTMRDTVPLLAVEWKATIDLPPSDLWEPMINSL